MILRSIILLELILHAFTIHAQLNETYFHDQEGKGRGIAKVSKRDGSFLIIGGNSFDQYVYQPSITKTDLNGDVIWTTTTLDTKVYGGAANIDNLIISGESIYATCLIDFKPAELWKVDAASGTILWKKAFSAFNPVRHLLDYDETRFLISYVSYNGTEYDTKISFIDKTSGTITNTLSIGGHPWQTSKHAVGVDSQKNIYYTQNDSIFKINGLNPDVVLWKTKRAEANMLEYQHIHIDKDDQIFLFGSRNSSRQIGKVLGVNKDTGAFIWEAITTDIPDEVSFSAMADDGINLFVTWKHLYVGGGNYNMWTTKIEKATGNIAWRSIHSFESDKTEAALSLDLDNEGNVLLTGYHHAANYGPGEWAFVKLNGTTGVSIYGKTITKDGSISNDLGMGIAVYYIDGSAYLVGNIETFHSGYKHSTPAIVKVNPVSEEILYTKYLYGRYQMPSRTIDIKKKGNTTFQLKQVGDHAILGLYNGNAALWEKSLEQNYALLGSNLIVSPDETVTVTGYSVTMGYTPPFYDEFFIDSIHTFTYDLQGTLLKKNGFAVYSYGAYPLETLKEGNSLFVLYRKNSTLHLRKIENGIISPEQTLDLRFIPGDITPSAPQNMLPYSDTEIMVVGYQNTIGPRLIKVNKNTLTMTAVNISSALFYKINYVQKLNNQTLLLAGKNVFNKDLFARYNLTTSTITWSKEYTASSEFYKFVLSPDLNSAYTIGVKGNDLAVKKIETSTGNMVWTYDYNYSNAVKDIPLDIDLINTKLIVVGYNEVIATPEAANTIFIHTLNTAGQFDNVVFKPGEFAGINKASVVSILPNGEAFIGGNLNHDNQLDGFVYILNTSACDQFLEGLISQVTDHLVVSDENAEYQWKDCLTGQKIPGADKKEFTPIQSGMYGVEVSKNGCSITSECFAFTNCNNVLQAIVSKVDDILFVSDENAEYQWINCITTSEIPDSVNRSFTPSVSGSYQVRVSKGNCTMTSACFDFVNCETGIEALVTQIDDHLVVSDDAAEYQWIDCATNLEIPEATDKTFAPEVTGEYSVQISKDDCKVTSVCTPFEKIIAGIPSMEEPYLQVFPNPAAHQVTIDLGKQVNMVTISIKGSNGVVVVEGKVMNKKDVTLSTKDLPPGVYFIFIDTGSSLPRVKKLIIE